MAGADPSVQLLFALLAVRLELIGPAALIPALGDWVAGNRSRSLCGLLVERGAVDPPTRELLDRLTVRHIEAHDGDPGRSLAALGPFPAIQGWLRTVDDDGLREAVESLSASMTQVDPGGSDVAPECASSPGLNSTILWNPAEPGPDTRLEWSLPDPPYGRYTILRRIARGGLGEVFLARDEGLNREVALKVILPRPARHPLCCARFLIEAEITAGLEHPGIVPVHAVGRCEDGRAFYCMRLIRGEDFPAAIARFHVETSRAERGKMLIRLLRHFVDVCNVVAYAHSRGVIHRDIKPANIRLGRYGETFLVDWGLAKPIDRPELPGCERPDSGEAVIEPVAGTGVTPTAIGATVGTPRYMSPEQADGAVESLGVASDVYSLGATLYHLLCGQDPLQDVQEVTEILERVKAGAIPSPRSLRPDASTTLEAICLKAMAVRPERRYPTARALAEDVECWLADLPTSVPERLGRRIARWERRHSVLIRVVGATLGLFALGELLSRIVSS